MQEECGKEWDLRVGKAHNSISITQWATLWDLEDHNAERIMESENPVHEVSEDKDCHYLNIIAPHTLIESGTLRRCVFVGVGVALLEEVHHCGGGL